MSNKKIMIVDDDKDFLAELEEMMSLSGYDLVAVNDATSASKIASKTKPDLILLDLKMPGKSGFQLAEEIRQLPELSGVPIIAMSSYYRDDYAFLLKVFGIKSCLKKPFNPLDAIAAVETALK